MDRRPKVILFENVVPFPIILLKDVTGVGRMCVCTCLFLEALILMFKFLSLARTITLIAGSAYDIAGEIVLDPRDAGFPVATLALFDFS